MDQNKLKELNELAGQIKAVEESIKVSRSVLLELKARRTTNGHDVDGAGIALYKGNYNPRTLQAGAGFMPHAEKALENYIEELEHAAALARVKFKHM